MKFIVMIITAIIICLTVFVYFQTTKEFINGGVGAKPGTDVRIENAKKAMDDLNAITEEQLKEIEKSTR